MASITKINLLGVEYNLTDKEAQSLIKQLQENTYNKTEVDSLVSAIDDKVEGIDLTPYETIEGAANKYQPKGNYLTEHQSLENYVTKDELPNEYDDTALSNRVSVLEAKEDKDTVYDDTAIRSRLDALEAIDHSLYLTLHLDISGKADKSYVDGKVADLVNSAPETLDTLGELATAITEHKEVTDALDAAITNKVDKVTGKGLSTNDYTAADKAKVDATPTFWVGTQSEYDAITTKDNKTFYYITEG